MSSGGMCGGWEKLDVNSSDVKRACKFAFDDYKSRQKFDVFLDKVISCTKQEFDEGVNYNLVLKLSSKYKNTTSSWTKTFNVTHANGKWR